jgi:hypothetical protein
VKYGAKNYQMLIGTENTIYKGKILNIKNTQIHGLTSKGRSSLFSKNTSKLPFLAQEA